MFKMLKRVFIDYTERRLIFKLYQKGTAAIQFGKIEEETRLRKGVRQGCTLFPSIFNTYIQEAINTMREIWIIGYLDEWQENVYATVHRRYSSISWKQGVTKDAEMYVRNSAQWTEHEN